MKRESVSLALFVLSCMSLVTLIESDGDIIWSEVGTERRREKSATRWSAWSDWRDNTCDVDFLKRRRTNCINDERSCDYFEQVQSCLPREFKSARLADCHFLVLSSQGEVLNNQQSIIQALKECESKQNCVGIFSDANTDQLRSLARPLPIGRKLYEEKCSTKSRKTSTKIFIHQTRLNDLFSCSPTVFPTQGLPELNNRYVWNSNVVSKQQAVASCEQLGAKVVEIESPEELAQLHKSWTFDNWYHTGAIRESSEGANRKVWLWQYSRLPADQDWLWLPGEPNGDGSIAQILPRQRLNDATSNNMFICECQNPIVEYFD